MTGVAGRIGTPLSCPSRYLMREAIFSAPALAQASSCAAVAPDAAMNPTMVSPAFSGTPPANRTMRGLATSLASTAGSQPRGLASPTPACL